MKSTRESADLPKGWRRSMSASAAAPTRTRHGTVRSGGVGLDDVWTVRFCPGWLPRCCFRSLAHNQLVTTTDRISTSVDIGPGPPRHRTAPASTTNPVVPDLRTFVRSIWPGWSTCICFSAAFHASRYAAKARHAPQPPSVVVWLDVSGRGSRECACFLVLSFPWTRNRLVESGQGRGTMNHARGRERGNKESLLPAPRCKPRLHSNPQSIDACAAAAREGEASREKFQTCMDLQNKFLPRR